MKEQEALGIIQEVDEKVPPYIRSTYYMPHQAVIREDKITSKLRIVYYASSKMNGPSLNECLEARETYFADLFGVMIRFRWHRIGIMADIEKAFLSIGIEENDRDALRFLWFTNPLSDDPKIRKMRFPRVCFGVASSMWHLGATIKHHLSKYKEDEDELVKKIEGSLYVDDFSSGCQTPEEAVVLHEKARKIFLEAGMNLRKWRSNHDDVNRVMNIQSNDDKAAGVAQLMLNPEDTSAVKVLGIPWNTDNDYLEISLR